MCDIPSTVTWKIDVLLATWTGADTILPDSLAPVLSRSLVASHLGDVNEALLDSLHTLNPVS